MKQLFLEGESPTLSDECTNMLLSKLWIGYSIFSGFTEILNLLLIPCIVLTFHHRPLQKKHKIFQI